MAASGASGSVGQSTQQTGAAGAMSSSRRDPPPSPRTLHERLGLDQHQQEQEQRDPNPLLDRVAGVKESSEGRSTAQKPRSAAWPAQQKTPQEIASLVEQKRQPASASATPLEARISKSPMAWPVRGRQAPYISAVRQPSASSGTRLDYGEDSRHHGPSSIPSTEARSDEAASSSHNTQEGRIRVSEDGEVWRSPPHRPVQDAALAHSLARSMGQLSKSIDLTVPSESNNARTPGFSPLPPFARPSSGSASNEVKGPYRGIPAQGFRRSSGFDRAASRPPQIASSSGSSRRSSNKYPLPRRSSQPYPTMPSYQERQNRWAQAPYADYGTSRYDSCSNQSQRDSSDYNERRGWDSHRSPAILASPASSKGSSQVFGEEVSIHTSAAASSGNYNNRSWTRPPTPNRSMATARGGAESKPIPLESFTSAVPSTTSSGQQPSKLAAESSSLSSGAPGASRLPAKSGPIVKVEPKSAALPPPPTSSSSVGTSSAPNASSSSSAIQPAAVRGNGPVGKDGFRQPLPSTISVKREPGSPPSVPRISLPPQPSTPQALFNPFTQSPEERKPVIRHGFTPPPRPRLDGNTTETQNAPSRKPSPPPAVFKQQGLPPLARDVAQARAERVQGQAAEYNVAAAKASSLQAHTIQPEVPRQTPIASTSRLDSAPKSQLISSGLDRSMDLRDQPTSAPLSLHSLATKVARDTLQSDMEVDELAPSPEEPSSRPANIMVAARTTETLSLANMPSLPPSKPLKSGSSGSQSLEGVIATSGKGKERARELLPASSLPRTGPPPKSSSKQVIDLASEDDEEPVKASLPRVSSNSRALSPIQTTSLQPRLPAVVADVAAVQSPSIAARSVPGEERTRVFPLSPKVLAFLQAEGNRPRAALRKFVDGKYEELEVELKSPLRRIDEIQRGDTIRLVYIELELAPYEVAIPLPQECLKLSGSSSAERDQRRSAFTIQQVVRFAKEGKEAEITRYTPAYLIVVFKSGHQPFTSVSVRPTVQQTKSSANQLPQADVVPNASLLVDVAAKQSRTSLSLDIQKQKEKKRKRLSKEALADDTTSISSLDSTASSTHKKDKGSVLKQARKSLESQTVSRNMPNLPGPSTGKPAAPPQKLNSATTPALPRQSTAGSSSAESRLSLGKPRDLKGVMHSMYGSLSIKLKDTREKPRMFFQTETFSRGCIAVSMRGHLHYWKSGMDKPVVISENQHTHSSLSVQAALWSDEHRLAIVAHTSSTAAAIGNVQIVNMFGSKATSANRRTVLAANGQEDKTGLSALAWDPSQGDGLRMAGAEQNNRRLCLWSVDPGDRTTNAKLTCLHNITTHHTNSIRSILWQPESNKIFTGGADKRVCTIDARTSQTVDEWKENLIVNRIYRRDANLVLICLAGNRDQFRCVDLRTPRSVTAISFSQQTKKGESLGQYLHGDIMNDYFAYPVEEELHIWDLRNTRHLKSIAGFSGVVQARYTTTTKLTLLEKKHFTTLAF